MAKSTLINFLDNALILVWGIFLLLLPFTMTTLTTDAFMMPKEVAFGIVVLLSLIIWGAKMVIAEKVTLKRTPFDVPILLFLFAILLSSLFAVNRADSLIATIPVILAGFGYFIFVNNVKRENTILFLISALLVGGAGLSFLALFSFFKVYPLLFSFTHIQSFTPLGSLVEQAFFLLFLLPISLSFASPILKGHTNNRTISFSVTSLLITIGLLLTLLQLFTTQKPSFLPFETAFQTAFAAISQDSGRIAQGFLFGSGFGNFAAVFTRFKQASFNSNPLWATQFANSSSFILELLATTGVLGMVSFLFLLFRAVTNAKTKKRNPLYLAIGVLGLISLFLPYSFFEIALLFVLLSLFAVIQALKQTSDYYEMELKLVALKKGVISLQQVTVPSQEKYEYNRPTAIVVAAIFVVIVLAVGWFGGTFFISDIAFQHSLVSAQANNGTVTYKDETQAITTFPYRSAYYRIFAQTNIALASSLAGLQKGSPSTQTQNTLYALIQQGITAGKQATALAPQTVANWQNLSSIYRSLIGVGQNADNFAILYAQQAIVYDSSNPQEYLALGGIYYQLGQWDNAIRAFQQAATLKQDYPNAYYNLGHAYEQKQDYTNALGAYQTTQQLVSQDKPNLDKVNADITALQAKMGNQNQAQPTPTPTPKETKTTKTTVPYQPLNLSGETQTNPATQTTPAPQTPVTSPVPAQ